jgi:hypothetical protein
MYIMDAYDKSKIGRLIAWGGDHLVYGYGEGYVLKFSFIDSILGKAGRAKNDHDYAIAKKYFGEFILDTQFVASANGLWRGKLQKKLTGHALTKKDLERGDVRRQFTEIMSAYKNLLDEGHVEIDLMGRHGIIFRTLSNIFVTSEDKLYIFDTSLLHIDKPLFLRPVMALIRYFAVKRQDSTIKLFQEAAQAM